MEINGIITQVKSNEELDKKGSEIIDSLKGFNLVEKYKIMNSLYKSLLEIIKKENILIENEKK